MITLVLAAAVVLALAGLVVAIAVAVQLAGMRDQLDRAEETADRALAHVVVAPELVEPPPTGRHAAR